MSTERENNRSRWPQFADAVDFLRSRGAVIENAWVADSDGVVLAGRRPMSVIDEVWVEFETLEDMRRDFAPPTRQRGRRR